MTRRRHVTLTSLIRLLKTTSSDLSRSTLSFSLSWTSDESWALCEKEVHSEDEGTVALTLTLRDRRLDDGKHAGWR